MFVGQLYKNSGRRREEMGRTAASSTKQDYQSLDRKIFGSCLAMIYICDFSYSKLSVFLLGNNYVDWYYN